MKRLIVYLVLGLVFVPASKARQVVHVESDAALDNRFAETLERSRDMNESSGFWIGYSIEREMCENCFSGMFDTHRKDRASLNELIYNIKLDDSFKRSQSVNDTARKALSGFEPDAGRMVRKPLAVLMHFGPSSRQPEEIQMSNMSLYFNLDDEPIFWMGEAELAESIDVLKGLFDKGTSKDARKGAIWAIGTHDLPEQAVPFLSDVLKSKESAELRKSAAFSLGNQETETALDILMDAARSDGSVEVARAAVFAMGNMDLERVTDRLESVVSDVAFRTEVRKAALYSLGNRDEDAALVTLERIALGDDDPELQKAAAYAIGNMDRPDATQALVSILGQARSLEVRKAALYAIGNTESADAAVILMETAVGSDSAELAKAAVYALSNTVEDDDVSSLLEVLRKSTRSEVRKAAVYSIGNSDSDSAVEALRTVLKEDKDPDVRKAAVHALGNMDSPQARKALLALIGDLQ